MFYVIPFAYRVEVDAPITPSIIIDSNEKLLICFTKSFYHCLPFRQRKRVARGLTRDYALVLV